MNLDPRLLEEFRLAERARVVLGEAGWKVEAWVALRLARTEGDHLREEIDRILRLKAAGRAASPGGLVIDSILRIRQTLGRRADEVRRALTASATPMDPAVFELVLATLVRDGAAAVTEDSIRGRAAQAGKYVEPAAAPFVSDAAKVPAAESLPAGVDPELLEDLRQARLFVRAAGSARAPVELWEALTLAVRDRQAVVRAAERLRRPSVDDPSHELIRFLEGLLDLRSRRLERVRALRRYIGGLPIGRYSRDVLELAVAFIFASAEGERRVEQWLEDPERTRREAAIRVEGVIGRAQKYLHALSSAAA